MKILNTNYESRVYGLDVFRAIAILIVVMGHGGLISGNLFDSFPSFPLIDGVELFFVLSGFLIGSILIKTLENEKKINLSSLINFWKRRWFRTLPNYYLILFVNLLLVKYEFINGDIQKFSYKFLFFLQNFSEGFVDFFWESWSLSIEEWFYIVLPIFILIFNSFLSRKNTLLSAIILLIIFPLLYRISNSDMNVDGFWLDVHFRKVVLTRMDAIIYGVLAAYIKFYHASFFQRNRNWMFILGLIIIYINIYVPKEPNDFYTKTFSYSITSLGAALLLAKADSIKKFKYNVIGKSVTFISVISYSMYLVNLALVAQVIEKNFPPQTKLENAYMYIVYWLATILVSTIIYKFYEKPITGLRDKV